jgi:hypothetical protein
VTPTGVPPPREPTKLERLAELAGMEPDELRALLRAEIEEADHELMLAVLAEAIAESAAVAPAADDSETTPGPHQQRI